MELGHSPRKQSLFEGYLVMSNKKTSLPSDSEKREIVRRLIADVKSDSGKFAVSPGILKAIARCQEEFNPRNCGL